MNAQPIRRPVPPRKLVRDLRDGLEITAVDAALHRGQISPRQAKRLTQYISTILDMRRNPVHAVTDAVGQCIGEASTRNGGATWIGCRFGREGPLPAAEFGRLEEATHFVVSDAPGDAAISATYQARPLFI